MNTCWSAPQRALQQYARTYAKVINVRSAAGGPLTLSKHRQLIPHIISHFKPLQFSHSYLECVPTVEGRVAAGGHLGPRARINAEQTQPTPWGAARHEIPLPPRHRRRLFPGKRSSYKQNSLKTFTYHALKKNITQFIKYRNQPIHINKPYRNERMIDNQYVYFRKGTRYFSIRLSTNQLYLLRVSHKRNTTRNLLKNTVAILMLSTWFYTPVKQVLQYPCYAMSCFVRFLHLAGILPVRCCRKRALPRPF